MMKNKKGVANVGMMLFSIFKNPVALLGLGIFIVVMMVMFYFMLGKIVGTALILIGAMSLMNKTWGWHVGLIMIILGILMFWNPFGFSMLSIVPRVA